MALYEDQNKKSSSALRPPAVGRDPAGALPAVGRWAMNRPEPQGFTPTMPDYTAPNPTNAPVMTTFAPTKPAASAAPVVVPAGASATQARATPGQATNQNPAAPRTPAAAPATSSSPALGVGAPATAGGGGTARRPVIGGGASVPYKTGTGRTGTLPAGIAVVRQSNGVNAFGGTGLSVAGATRPGVQSQNFGTETTAGPVSGVRPRVASTYGQSVISMPNDNVVRSQRPTVAVRGADQMAEHYTSKEVAEAQKKQLSDLDSQRFRLEMIGSNPGRRGRAAIEALGDNARQQSAIVDAQAQAAAGAVQGRAQRDATLANTGLEQSGAMERLQIEDATRREANQMGYRADMARTNAESTRPTYQTDADGNLVRVTGTNATNVTNGGRPVAMPQPRASAEGQVTPAMQYEAISKQIESLMALPPAPEEQQAYNEQLAALEAQRGALLPGNGAQAPAPAGMKQVGTSGGKPVYEDAQGNRFTN